ncbi:MAG: hypothetical protein U0821_18745 [Chloroflexota bacterium]
MSEHTCSRCGQSRTPEQMRWTSGKMTSICAECARTKFRATMAARAGLPKGQPKPTRLTAVQKAVAILEDDVGRIDQAMLQLDAQRKELGSEIEQLRREKAALAMSIATLRGETPPQAPVPQSKLALPVAPPKPPAARCSRCHGNIVSDEDGTGRCMMCARAVGAKP